MVQYYPGNKTGGIPGLLGDPYYWWEAGAMFGALLDYWHYTGDDSYNKIASEAMLWQVGPEENYNPPNQSKAMGNDDQCFWAMTAMRAAELNFPNPPIDKPQWLALAQAVFNSQAMRWDNSTCGGGLRWQVFPLANGYNYKNSISNGCFFNLASRLAAYTGNTTFSDWATRTFEWSYAIGLISPKFEVFDGTDDAKNCSDLNNIQWSYNSGIWTHGSSVLYNFTGNDVWKQRAANFWNASAVFFNEKNIMYEVACEPQSNCNYDQKSFKAYLSRWMAASWQVAPFLEPLMKPFLIASAQAAAAQCSGGADGVTCGTHWTESTYDGTNGVGQQLSALETIQNLLVDSSKAPLTNKTGGTSIGNPTAGTGGDRLRTSPVKDITAADRAGAGILTFLMLAMLLGGAW